MAADASAQPRPMGCVRRSGCVRTSQSLAATARDCAAHDDDMRARSLSRAGWCGLVGCAVCDAARDAPRARVGWLVGWLVQILAATEGSPRGGLAGSAMAAGGGDGDDEDEGSGSLDVRWQRDDACRVRISPRHNETTKESVVAVAPALSRPASPSDPPRPPSASSSVVVRGFQISSREQQRKRVAVTPAPSPPCTCTDPPRPRISPLRRRKRASSPSPLRARSPCSRCPPLRPPVSPRCSHPLSRALGPPLSLSPSASSSDSLSPSGPPDRLSPLSSEGDSFDAFAKALSQIGSAASFGLDRALGAEVCHHVITAADGGGGRGIGRPSRPSARRTNGPPHNLLARRRRTEERTNEPTPPRHRRWARIRATTLRSEEMASRRTGGGASSARPAIANKA